MVCQCEQIISDEHGVCIRCQEKVPCELCETNVWVMVCGVCEERFICSDCKTTCQDCGLNICYQCDEEGELCDHLESCFRCTRLFQLDAMVERDNDYYCERCV